VSQDDLKLLAEWDLVLAKISRNLGNRDCLDDDLLTSLVSIFQERAAALRRLKKRQVLSVKSRNR
jgi:hypothetical protein